MNALKTYHLVEAEPHPLVAQALNAELFERCRIERPVPVHFLPMPRWGGSCPEMEDTREGELRVADHLLDERKDPAGMQDRLVHVYLHELSHRLTPGHWHNPAFLSVNLLLFIRGGNDRFDRPLLWGIDLYDIQDWEDVEHSSIGEALNWAYKQADELAPSELSAEACAAEIMRRFDDWKAWKAKTPEREAEALAKADAARQKTAATIHGLQTQIERLRQARWEWLVGGIAAGMLIFLVFLILAKGAL